MCASKLWAQGTRSSERQGEAQLPMSDSQLDQPRLELRVDAVVVQALRCRHHLDERGGFDVLLDDPQVGCFALTDAFRLELRDGASDWRQVTLDELKKI